MWASHTLVAYTEVKSAGLEPNRAVGAAVSATVITDVLALVILGFAAAPDVADTRSSAADHVGVLPVWIGIFALGGFCLWLLPRVTNWFFVNVGRTRVQRFVWTLGGMAAGALVSILGGTEGLVGAFRITRIAQSEVDGTVNLATESQASLILLPWSGPGIGGRFFGGSIDEIGERSPVPTIAASLRNGEWSHVMFFQGRTKNLNVRGEDSALALEVARRIATHEGIELVVWASQVDDLDEPEELPEVNEYSGRGSSGLDSITPGDLVVVPAYVAQDALALGAIRLRRQLARTSLLIVAGPRRLTITSRQYADRVLGGAAFNRRNREALASTWEGSVR
jgi:hypothetical protein